MRLDGDTDFLATGPTREDGRQHGDQGFVDARLKPPRYAFQNGSRFGGGKREHDAAGRRNRIGAFLKVDWNRCRGPACQIEPESGLNFGCSRSFESTQLRGPFEELGTGGGKRYGQILAKLSDGAIQSCNSTRHETPSMAR